MKTQKTLNNQSNSEKEEWSWKQRMELKESTFLTSDYTTKLQPSRQYGTGTKQKYRPQEQDRKPRNKATQLWEPYL